MDRERLLATAPLLAAIIWGGMYVVSKWGFSEIPPLTLAFLRILIGAGILYVGVRVTSPSRSFSRQEWRRFAMLAVWLTVALTTQFVGTDLTNASQGSLLTILTPIFMVVLGVAALGEHLTAGKVLGMGIAALGTLVVLVGQYDLETLTSGGLFGVGLLLLSACSFAAFSAFGKPLIDRYSALETATYATVLSVPMFGILVPVEIYLRPASFSSVSITLPVVGVILYLGVLSTAVAWYCWYKGMEYADASTVAVYFFAQPVVGIALGTVFLEEQTGVSIVGGAVLLVLGVFLVDRAGRSADESP